MLQWFRFPNNHPERAEKGSNPIFCSSCGAQISDKSAFCPSCGKPVQQQSAQPQFNPNDPQTLLHRSTNAEKIAGNNTAYHQPPIAPQGVPMQRGYIPQNAAQTGQKLKKGRKVALFVVLFLILGAGFTVGGIFIGKALRASEQA